MRSNSMRYTELVDFQLANGAIGRRRRIKQFANQLESITDSGCARAALIPGCSRHRTELARLGLSRVSVILGVLVTVGLIAAASWGTTSYLRAQTQAPLITQPVIVGEFHHDIIERGDVESSNNTNVICEIPSPEGVSIIDIVAEGTAVKKGDRLVQLDDSTLRKDVNTQKIAVNTTAAALAKAQNELDAAEISLREYEKGLFLQEEEKLQSEEFVAEENFRRAENYLKYSKGLAERGYITAVQLEADGFAVEKTRKELAVAKTKLVVLREYTRQKEMRKRETDIKTAKANVDAETAKHQIEIDKLKTLENHLGRCEIFSPADGQVVYNNQNTWRESPNYIRKGNKVREQQVIIQLPDPKAMQVKAKIAEARVNKVKSGMVATITFEALRDARLTGTIKSVGAFASDENWFNPNVKEYDAVVDLANPPPSLKPGMTAQVSIRVESIPNALQVPIQAVIERNGKHYCLLQSAAGDLSARDVTLGSSNDKTIVVTAGLEPGDSVVMNPKAHFDKVAPAAAKEATAKNPAAKEPAAKESAVGEKPVDSAQPTTETKAAATETKAAATETKAAALEVAAPKATSAGTGGE